MRAQELAENLLDHPESEVYENGIASDSMLTRVDITRRGEVILVVEEEPPF